jgi:FlaG/FlaF family flagellin (archaellin)
MASDPSQFDSLISSDNLTIDDTNVNCTAHDDDGYTQYSVPTDDFADTYADINGDTTSTK